MINAYVLVLVQQELGAWPLPAGPHSPIPLSISGKAAATGEGDVRPADFDPGHLRRLAPIMADDDAKINTIIEEVRSHDTQVRIAAFRQLCTVADAVGPERTRLELVPYVSEFTDDEDEVLLVLAEELVSLDELPPPTTCSSLPFSNPPHILCLSIYYFIMYLYPSSQLICHMHQRGRWQVC